jgi:hypothetical protein
MKSEFELTQMIMAELRKHLECTEVDRVLLLRPIFAVNGANWDIAVGRSARRINRRSRDAEGAIARDLQEQYDVSTDRKVTTRSGSVSANCGAPFPCGVFCVPATPIEVQSGPTRGGAEFADTVGSAAAPSSIPRLGAPQFCHRPPVHATQRLLCSIEQASMSSANSRW